ncbi:MAG: hypothetical protein Tp1111DCM1126091_45 [Prokaryotic dsDNA virus sp.]|nr:MAG: hypothetical protein Tp1111DCM1126091_45 [Prokaryotic dsDNA virus sp.]|tara:strand:+ start:82442 stop:82879 length:438 start_codon:yes stop_codon:yes gene_type:complete
MKLKCLRAGNSWFTEGKVYNIDEEWEDAYVIMDDDCDSGVINKDSLVERNTDEINLFEIVADSTSIEVTGPLWKDQTEPVQVAAIRSIQEQCSRANLSISIDPEGFNIFDCDTDMQVMVHSVADVLEILESKLKFKSDMEKYQWM